MAKLIYSAIASLDGYVEDKSGSFEWAAPDEELFAFVNDFERPMSTYLDGGCLRWLQPVAYCGRPAGR